MFLQKMMIKDPSSQNLFHTEELPHVKIFKNGKSNFSPDSLQKKEETCFFKK